MVELIAGSHFVELAKLDPREVCKRTGCSFDPERNCYSLNIWATDYRISLREKRVECSDQAHSLHELFGLFAVHYLLTAQDCAPAGQWISEKDLPGGATFFRGPHAIPTHLITAKVENSPDAFRRLCTARHGTPLGMADAASAFHITERIPVAVLYWAGDDDFPAEAKILFDKTLAQHFALDIVFALAVGICEELGG